MKIKYILFAFAALSLCSCEVDYPDAPHHNAYSLAYYASGVWVSNVSGSLISLEGSLLLSEYYSLDEAARKQSPMSDFIKETEGEAILDGFGTFRKNEKGVWNPAGREVSQVSDSVWTILYTSNSEVSEKMTCKMLKGKYSQFSLHNWDITLTGSRTENAELSSKYANDGSLIGGWPELSYYKYLASGYPLDYAIFEGKIHFDILKAKEVISYCDAYYIKNESGNNYYSLYKTTYGDAKLNN